MSIGLPGHLGPRVLSRAFTRAGHAVAGVCLAATLTIAFSVQSANPALSLWPAMVALLPFALLIWFSERSGSTLAVILYVVVGAAALYWYSITLMTEFDPHPGTNAFSLSLLKIALMFAGAPRRVPRWAIASPVVGFVVAELVVQAAALQAGVAIKLDTTSLVSLLVVYACILFNAIMQRAGASARPTIYRAALDEQLAAIRARVEGRAAAVMHDTVLNQLAAIASEPDGPVRPELRDEVRRDITYLVGQEWLAEQAPGPGGLGVEWERTALYAAVRDARRRGLTVAVTGDLSSLATVSPAAASALAQAARQCLVNVIKHAGTAKAEVVVQGSATHVVVMVIDGGRGFSQDQVGADRLGLRQSVRQRMESVGGDVQVWSAPGRGTSVMMTVPVASDADVGKVLR